MSCERSTPSPETVTRNTVTPSDAVAVAPWSTYVAVVDAWWVSVALPASWIIGDSSETPKR